MWFQISRLGPAVTTLYRQVRVDLKKEDRSPSVTTNKNGKQQFADRITYWYYNIAQLFNQFLQLIQDNVITELVWQSE